MRRKAWGEERPIFFMNMKRKFTAFAAAFLLLLSATPSSAALEFETDTEVRDAAYDAEPTQSLEAGVPDGIPEEMLETEGETTRAALFSSGFQRAMQEQKCTMRGHICTILP